MAAMTSSENALFANILSQKLGTDESFYRDNYSTWIVMEKVVIIKNSSLSLLMFYSYHSLSF